MFFMKTEHNPVAIESILSVDTQSFDTPFIGFYNLWKDNRAYGVAPGDYCAWKPKTRLKLSGKFVEVPLKVG